MTLVPRTPPLAGPLLLALLPGLAAAQIDVRAATVTAAEVPAAAYGPPVDHAVGYAVAEIKPGSGAYWVTEGTHQAMFVVTDDGVVVVDAPPILGGHIAEAVADVTDRPVTHLVYSHPHADHIAGAWQFPQGIEVTGTAEAAAALAAPPRPERPAPFGAFVGGQPVPAVTRAVAGGETLEIGGQAFEFHQLPQSHSGSDLAVRLPEHGILMAVDLVWAGWVPFDRLGAAEDVGGYLDAHDAILALDWDVLVSGHMGRLATREDVETNLAYVRDLVTAATAALGSVTYQAAADRTGHANPYATVETYFDMVAHEAAQAVEAEWTGRLAGADVWTYSNARAVMMWLRLN